MGHQAPAPVTESCSGLALPLDTFDEALEFAGCFLHRCPRLQKRLARFFEVLRIGVLDQVDHRVELVALEGRPAGGTAAAEAEHLHDVLHLAGHVGDDQLPRDAFLVLLLLFRGSQFRLLVVTHQLSPKSS
ncbi:hypothetical protein [Streptomyces sp. NPDC056844]|uniref:hypothetical protein n=1 Tax=unclassified Streptomyces TaxID=2593676 RepID=UPI0036CEB6FD